MHILWVSINNKSELRRISGMVEQYDKLASETFVSWIDYGSLSIWITILCLSGKSPQF
jgi:hypothetical protein